MSRELAVKTNALQMEQVALQASRTKSEDVECLLSQATERCSILESELADAKAAKLAAIDHLSDIEKQHAELLQTVRRECEEEWAAHYADEALDQVSKDMRICHFARICVDLFDG